MLSLFSYSQPRPSSIYSVAAEMDHWHGTGGTHDPYNLQRCPRTHSPRHSPRHLNRCNAVQCTILTNPFLWHLPTTHSSLLHQLSTKMEVADPKHGRLMTGPSPLHDALKALGLLHLQIRVGNFVSLDDPTFALLPSHAPPCLFRVVPLVGVRHAFRLCSCTIEYPLTDNSMFIYRGIFEYCLYATLIRDIP